MGNGTIKLLKLRAANLRGFALTSMILSAAFAPLLCIGGCTGMVSGAPSTSRSAVQVTPTSVDFGSTGVGTKVAHSASVTNNGKTTVTLTKASLTNSQFSVSGLRFPVTILSGQKSRFMLWFNGSKAGKASGMLNFQGDATFTDPVELTGTAGSAAGNLQISASSHDFGKVTVNTVVNATLTLTNSGASNLTISSLVVAGATFAATGVTIPQTIPAGGKVALNLTFSPKTVGNYSGSVAIASNDPDAPTTKVTLAGEATTTAIGTLTATPATLSFSNVKVGSSATAVATVRNSGTANVTLSQINQSGSGFSASGIATPVLIVPGESVSLNVKFTPTSSGTSNGSIALINSLGGITSVSVSGTSVQSGTGLSVSPGNISFGNVVTGVSNTQTVQVTNTSSASVSVTSANVTGAGFSTTGLTLPLTLIAGQSSTFNVQFHPTTAVVASGSLTLASNALNSPITITLSGTGVTAGLTLSVNPSSVGFGNVTVGSTASRSIAVSNTGNSNVTISSITLSGAKFSLSGGSAVTLSPSQSLTLTVQFAPTTSGAASGSIAIASNASGSPAAIALSGSGVTPVQHTVALSWNASASSLGYNIYRSGFSGAGYARLNSSADTALSYSDSSVQSSQTYFYVTTALDSAGTESAFSSEVSVNIP